MKIEVCIEIDDATCEAEVVDPHGNVWLLTDPEPEGLMQKVAEEVVGTYDACLNAEEGEPLMGAHVATPLLLREEWYGWKVICHFDNEPGPRLITPRSDPNKYESPADLLFHDIAGAVAWRDEEIENSEPSDPSEVVYIRSWVLCKAQFEQLDY